MEKHSVATKVVWSSNSCQVEPLKATTRDCTRLTACRWASQMKGLTLQIAFRWIEASHSTLLAITCDMWPALAVHFSVHMRSRFSVFSITTAQWAHPHSAPLSTNWMWNLLMGWLTLLLIWSLLRPGSNWPSVSPRRRMSRTVCGKHISLQWLLVGQYIRGRLG